MKLISAAAMALCVSTPVFAGTPVTLDFEGATGYYDTVAEFYNGGTDQYGQSGVNYGVSFNDSVVALTNDPAFDPYFSHAPSGATVMLAYDAGAVMNVAGGFVDAFSFYYASNAGAVSAVNVYSGLDGTGTLLASFSLLDNAQSGCTDNAYCNFDRVSAGFAGIAHSVSFGGNAAFVAYDNVSFTTAAAAVPEPSLYALFGAGLLALAALRRRSR